MALVSTGTNAYTPNPYAWIDNTQAEKNTVGTLNVKVFHLGSSNRLTFQTCVLNKLILSES